MRSNACKQSVLVWKCTNASPDGLPVLSKSIWIPFFWLIGKPVKENQRLNAYNLLKGRKEKGAGKITKIALNEKAKLICVAGQFCDEGFVKSTFNPPTTTDKPAIPPIHFV